MSIFDVVKGIRVPKNKFNLSHERKMSMKMGTLTPFLIQEIMPGDSFRVNTELFARLQPMLAPIYQRIRVKTDYFFVPNRLVWDNWQKFITGGDKGEDKPIHPYFLLSDTDKALLAKGTLADYLGVPTVDEGAGIIAGNIKLNALPFRAYQLIYNEYFRDQNLIDPIAFVKTDGNDLTFNITMAMQKRAWEKDYFTSCLPWAQKGGPVQVPGTATLKSPALALDPNGDPINGGSAPPLIDANGQFITNTTATSIDNLEGVNITVNDLRVAVRLQEWLERQARAGSRYIETILSNFGILSSDARLQRPEHLGGSVQPIVISEVLSTYQTADDTGYPQGTMSGHGITSGNGGFTRKFEEHGFVIGLMTVLPRTGYQQGLPKMFSRFDKLEYPWPSFAQLGEQAVLNKELYYDYNDNGNVENDSEFGYQSRYAECKYQPSTAHGDFRDNLEFWHQIRKFQTRPVLDKAFIEADPSKRIFAVTDQTEDEILCQIYNRVDAIRPLPYFNSPTI